MPRSTAYWTGNFYSDPEKPPRLGAPLRDLPPLAAARFRMLREGLAQLDGVTERVKFISPTWNWAWEYSVTGRKLCWLHVMETGMSGTFTLSDQDAGNLVLVPRLAAVIARAIRDGQRTGPLRWCWVEIADRKSVDAFLGFMKRKVAWLAATPSDAKGFWRSRTG